MTSDVSKSEDQANWKDFFSGMGQRIAHSGRCLKNPAYIGKVVKAAFATIGMMAVTVGLLGMVAVTRGRAVILDAVALIGIGVSIPAWRGVNRQWKEAGDLSQKIWDKSFPPSKSAPPMPKMLPSVFLFGKRPSAKVAFAGEREPSAVPEAVKNTPPPLAGPK